MTAKKTVRQRVIRAIAKALEIDEREVIPAASFVEDYEAGQLTMAKIMIGLDEEFGLEVPDEEIERLRTVQDVIDYFSEFEE